MRRLRYSPVPLVVLIALLALLLAGCGLPGMVATGGRLPTVGPAPTPAPLPPLRFPRDEAPHRDLTEWWYYTGHFRTPDHEYGFELTFFQTLRGQLPPYYAAHYAISDITRGEFHFDQRTAFGTLANIPPAGSRDGFALAIGGWTIRGLNGQDQLSAAMNNYTINLRLSDLNPRPIAHGGNGLITYGLAGFSYYYSRPLMSISGTLNDHGATVPVTGQAWMDHQWGNFVSLAGSGWDWYSIQLDNRTEYMLYVIRDAQKRPLATVGTAVAADGTASEIPSSAIHTQPTGTWQSPHTSGTYPSGWQITLDTPGVALTLTPALRDQELATAQSTGVAYWEGAVRIAGSAQGRPITGQGYVELTGYASIPSSAQGPAVP
ncbi:MAG: carotenoid 1,2-hydratase [Ktedonobacterales bacterium]|nr:carotenoid 1,2-hydratase [Ktedonobacterales bacterium]